jgi:hypothetical protein
LGDLLRLLARRAPGGPLKAEPGVAPGRGGAQRSRLDLIRLDSATGAMSSVNVEPRLVGLSQARPGPGRRAETAR